MRRSEIQLPLASILVLFLASSALGALISYSPGVSLIPLIAILLGVGIYVVIVRFHHNRRFLFGSIAILFLASALFSFVFISAYNQPFPPLQPNNLAGILELALPINVALVLHLVRKGHRTEAVVALFFALFLSTGLVLSSSRGAWLSLAVVSAVAIGAWVLTLVERKKWNIRIIAPCIFIFLFVVFLAGLYLRESQSPGVEQILSFGSSNTNEIPRLVLYQQVWRLVQDYLFTGSGLGTFPMVYSTYALQMNVYVLPHAHNILLQVWMEQGLIGVVALIGLVVGYYTWVWQHRSQWNWIVLGGLASTTVMLLHGLVDAPLWYSDWSRSLFLAPIALTVAGIHTFQSHRQSLRPFFAAGLISLVGVTIFWRQIEPMWYANLGSLAQTQVELRQYKFPDRLVEYVRHDGNLSLAEIYFRQALRLDPGNITANQRLAMIALAQGEYPSALALGQAAQARDSTNPITLELLGDAYLALGQNEQAYLYWERVDSAAVKLSIKAAVRYDRIGDPSRARQARNLSERLRPK